MPAWIRSCATLLPSLLITGCIEGNGDLNIPHTQSIGVELDANQVIGGSVSDGAATAGFTVNLDDEVVSGTVTVTGEIATRVSLYAGFAGATGTLFAELIEDGAGQWSLPADLTFTAADIAALLKGGFYVSVATAELPGGAMRGQLSGDGIRVAVAPLTGNQIVPAVATSAVATVGLTLDPDDGSIVVHVTGTGLDDALDGSLRQALAGLNGGVLVELVKDPDAPGHWFSVDAALDADGVAALARGALYAVIATPANMAGEVRGQIVPPGIALVFTELSGDAVVPPVATAASGLAATTIDEAMRSVNVFVHLFDIGDAVTATVNEGPAGQNGMAVLTLERDVNNMTLWRLEAATLDENQYNALRRQELYVNITTSSQPAGELRGQIEPRLAATAGFTVQSVVPANASAVPDLPAEIAVTFSANVNTSSATLAQVTFERAGGDASFDEGNEIILEPAGISSVAATLSIDLTGVANVEDVYRLTLDGSSAMPLVDVNGAVLDGDADGAPGGDFRSNFRVAAAAPSLAEVQQQVLTPSCALSGCHNAGTARAGLVLDEGLAYANLVGVASSEVPSLNRVEPGDPDASYIVHKLEGGPNIVGAQMPLTGGPLDAARIRLVRDWIAAGAGSE